MAKRWEKNWKQWQILFSWATKLLWTVTAATKLKDACSLEEKLWQNFVVVFQWLSCDWLFATPWTAECQASLSITISQSLLKLMSLSRWCHPAISSSVFPFSSCLQSFPVSGSFPMSRHFASGGQSIGASASASVSPVNIQDTESSLPSWPWGCEARLVHHSVSMTWPIGHPGLMCCCFCLMNDEKNAVCPRWNKYDCVILDDFLERLPTMPHVPETARVSWFMMCKSPWQQGKMWLRIRCWWSFLFSLVPRPPSWPQHLQD